MPPFAELGFTNSLKDSLVLSRSKLDEWIELQKAEADRFAALAQAACSDQQRQVDQAVTNLLALQLQSGLSVQQRDTNNEEDRLESTRKSLVTEIQVLKHELQESRSTLEALRVEHKHQLDRAKEARALKGRVERSKQTTIEDLTRGVVNYKYLGLDFIKAAGERMRIAFTQLDPRAPDRQFYFDIEAEDEWRVTDCEPLVSPETLRTLEEALNETDDFKPFVIGMRRAFVQLLNN